MAPPRKRPPRAERAKNEAPGAIKTVRDGDFVVAPGDARLSLDRALRVELGGSWEAARRLVRTGKVRVDDRVVTEPTMGVAGGARVSIRMAAPRPENPNGIRRSSLVYVDAFVVVVSKPPGISTVRHPSETDPAPPLDELVRGLLRKEARGTSVAPLGVVQRLDRETSGLLVFCRTAQARDDLRRQFRSHTVHRRYLALAHGKVSARKFVSRLVEDRGDGRRGSTTNSMIGREAITHVRPIEVLPSATLVECALETGRTHQIRIQLSEAGHPLVGERVYLRGFEGTVLPAPRLMLHAAELGFEHPHDGRPMRFTEALPADIAEMIDGLRPSPPC